MYKKSQKMNLMRLCIYWGFIMTILSITFLTIFRHELQNQMSRLPSFVYTWSGPLTFKKEKDLQNSFGNQLHNATHVVHHFPTSSKRSAFTPIVPAPAPAPASAPASTAAAAVAGFHTNTDIGAAVEHFSTAPAPDSEPESASAQASAPYPDNPPRFLGAVMILVSDWRSDRGRNCYFNSSMTALETKWRPNNPYPVILMDTKPWKYPDMKAIRKHWKNLDIRFVDVGIQFHAPSKGLNVTELEDHKNPLSDIAYKEMCSFFFSGFLTVPLLMEYKYLLRLDDDTCVQDNINFDMFQHAEKKDIAYAYTQTWFDGGFVTRGMYPYVENYLLEANNRNWTNSVLYKTVRNHPYFTKRNDNEKEQGGGVPAFNTNFEMINTVQYTQPEVLAFLQDVDRKKLIFHRRWGDAPLRFVIALLFWCPDQLWRLGSFDLQHSTWESFRMTADPVDSGAENSMLL
jgi:hypothetical protein